jgi:hypothetical protein
MTLPDPALRQLGLAKSDRMRRRSLTECGTPQVIEVLEAEIKETGNKEA